jgi:hypothetical protein
VGALRTLLYNVGIVGTVFEVLWAIVDIFVPSPFISPVTSILAMSQLWHLWQSLETLHVRNCFIFLGVRI